MCGAARHMILVALAIACAGCTSQEVLTTMDEIGHTMTGSPKELSNDEVISGLKEALKVGTERSVDLASVLDGFNKNEKIRIPFPPEAQKIKNTLLDLGLNKPVEDFETTLNRAAEEAAKEAVPVFVEAVTNMSITDGFKILNGGDRAATDYLREKTSETLVAKFRPVVERATKKVALAAQWTTVANAYNTTTIITGAEPLNPDLNGYVTLKAIDGLFYLLAEEEKKIRLDPVARTTELLRRVFGSR
jgi:hypothetical protein